MFLSMRIKMSMIKRECGLREYSIEDTVHPPWKVDHYFGIRISLDSRDQWELTIRCHDNGLSGKFLQLR